MSRPRRLTPGEIELARSVFGEAIYSERVRISVRSWGPWAVTLGSLITFPPSTGAPADFATESISAQAWLVHELTHVWQFQTALPRTLLSWAGVVLTGGYGPGLPGYRYTLPLADWDRLNLEQQASAVEHAFLLRKGLRTGAMPQGAAAHSYRGLPFVGGA
jgi:hypothetical protein